MIQRELGQGVKSNMGKFDRASARDSHTYTSQKSSEVGATANTSFYKGNTNW